MGPDEGNLGDIPNAHTNDSATSVRSPILDTVAPKPASATRCPGTQALVLIVYITAALSPYVSGRPIQQAIIIDAIYHLISRISQLPFGDFRIRNPEAH